MDYDCKSISTSPGLVVAHMISVSSFIVIIYEAGPPFQLFLSQTCAMIPENLFLTYASDTQRSCSRYCITRTISFENSSHRKINTFTTLHLILPMRCFLSDRLSMNFPSRRCKRQYKKLTKTLLPCEAFAHMSVLPPRATKETGDSSSVDFRSDHSMDGVSE